MLTSNYTIRYMKMMKSIIIKYKEYKIPERQYISWRDGGKTTDWLYINILPWLSHYRLPKAIDSVMYDTVLCSMYNVIRSRADRIGMLQGERTESRRSMLFSIAVLKDTWSVIQFISAVRYLEYNLENVLFVHSNE